MGSSEQGKHSRKRMVAWILAFILVISGVNIPAGKVRAEVTATQPAKGTGTQSDPYQITSEAELIWFRDTVNAGAYTSCAKLMNDITFSSTWEGAIGYSEEKKYQGIFDGCSFSITGMSFTTTLTNNSIIRAVFGYIDTSAEVKNLTVENASFEKIQDGAAIAICNYGTISNCHSVGIRVKSVSNYAAGICVKNSGTIENCTSLNDTIRGAAAGGGICAYNQYGGTIRKCYSIADNTGYLVNASDSVAPAGGIAGQNDGTIEYCYTSQNVSGTYSGGIAGQNATTGTVTACYGIGTVSSSSPTTRGKIIGYNHGLVQKSYSSCEENENSKTIGTSDLSTTPDCDKYPSSDFASGKVTYLLNGSMSSGELVWKQNIDQGTADAYPVLDSAHGTVYEVSEGVYSNSNEDPCATAHNLTPYAAKDATCVEDGNIAYWVCSNCKKYFSDADGKTQITQEQTVVLKTGHSYGNPVFTWSESNGNYTATATFTCTNANCISATTDHAKVVNCTVTSKTTDASCTQTGTTEYTATVTFNGKTYTDTKTVIGTTGAHTYGTPVFDWKEVNGSYTVTATYTCTASGCTDSVAGHTKTVDCTVKETERINATCTKAGSVTYKATVKDGTDYNTKQDTIASSGHSYTQVAAAEPTCENDGNIAYRLCSVCKKKFDANGTELTDSQVIKSATGHNYEWVANADGNTHSQICSKCSQVNKAESHSGGTATCHSKKICTTCKAEYGEYLAHTYGEPEFTWTKGTDGYKVTATISCTSDGCTNVVKDENCKVEETVSKKATCTTAGDKLYTATATMEVNGQSKKYTDTKLDEGVIAVAGHTLQHVEAKEAGQCVGDGYYEYWICSTCNQYFKDDKGETATTWNELIIKAPGHDTKGIRDNGDGTHSGTCSKCGEVFNNEEHKGGTATCVDQAVCEVCGAKYGAIDTTHHNYGATPEYRWSKSEDSYCVQVVFNCEDCDEDTENHEKIVESDADDISKIEIKKATCKASGTVQYTFERVIDGITYRDVKTEEVAQLEHPLKEIPAKEPTCTQDGNIAYYQCELCDGLYADASATTVITVDKVVLTATGHDISQVQDNGDGTHSGTCSKCGETFDRANHTGGTATCIQKAVCEACGAEYGEYGEHSYGQPVFTWTAVSDGYQVKATFACSVCTDAKDGHTLQQTCEVGAPVIVDATETMDGSKTYTAKVVLNGVTYTDERVDVIPAEKKEENPEDKEDPDDKDTSDEGEDSKGDENPNENDNQGGTNAPGDNGDTNPSGDQGGSQTTINITNNNTTVVVNIGQVVVDQSTNVTYKVVASSDGTPAVSYGASPNKNATKITVPLQATIDGVTYKVVSIEKNAFANNKKLKTVTIGNNVATIGDGAFSKCKNLSKVTIPSSVKKIGKNAFKECKKLKTITIKSTSLTKKNVGTNAFKGIPAKATIKVPKKLKNAYKKLLRSKGAGSKVKVK